MIETRNFVGGIDNDSSLYDVAKGWYLDALNVTKDAVADNNDFAVTNIVGNRVATYTLPAGTNKCIGVFPFELRNTVIYFVYNSNGNHSVLEFNATTRVTAKIFENLTDSGAIDILGFTSDNKITSVNVYPREEGDLLFFLDSLGRPTQMDITQFKAGTYTPVTRALINKAKMPPLSPPNVLFDNDTARRVNNFRTRLFRFKYRWVYDDFEKSVFSPISIVALPANILSDVFTNVITNNNVIRLTANAGGKNVKAVEIAMSYIEKSNVWKDFQSVGVLDKAALSLADDTDFPFAFYNESSYPDVDIQESIQLFDYVPDLANAQEMPNGNVLAYAGITEGYNKNTVADADVTIGLTLAGSGGSSGSLNGVLSANSGSLGVRYMEYTFSGIPAVGTVVTVKVKRKVDHTELTSSTYTTISGDTSATVALAIAANESLPDISVANGSPSIILFVISTGTYEALPSGFYSELTITTPAVTVGVSSIPTWKWSSERNIGRIYFDQKGKTNGVLYTNKVVFPAYSQFGSQVFIPYINYQINDVPPDWAYSMTFAVTKDNTQYIFWQTVLVKMDTDYIYFDVTNFATNASKNPTTEPVLNYTFQAGDRLRVIRNTTGFVFLDTYDAAIEGDVTNPKISGVTTTGRFIKIKKVAPFPVDISTSENYILELYRPAQQIANKENQVYYEFGKQYPILDPTLSTRRHGGEVTDQVVGVTPAEYNFYEGDSYFRLRTIPFSDTGYASFYMMDKNFVDFYISAVSSVDGRAFIVDTNAKRQYYSTLIRFGQAYQANTNINGLNRFYPANFDEYDYNFGDITRLKVRDRFLKVFQKFKIGVVPLYSQLTKDPNGNNVQVVTDKLLNSIQYRVGNFGLTAPESLASWNFADYGCDTNKGIVWRDSQDGVTPLSEMFKMNSWATVELPLRTGNIKIYGAINPKSNQYILALEAATGSAAQTLVFGEKANSFESFLSLYPEMITSLGTMLVAFKNGALWTHDSTTYNSFFGVSYPSYIKAVFNQNPTIKKSFQAVTEAGNVAWACPEIETQTIAYGTTPQQSNLVVADFEDEEGQFISSFKQDVNSVGGLVEGDDLKGKYIIVKFYAANASNLVILNYSTVKYLESPLNAR